MPDETKLLVQQQFGEHARAYTTSTGHAKGKSLERLVSLAEPQPDWRVLDVATGGGHTALAFSPHVRLVVAADLTGPMLGAAREFLLGKSATNIDYAQSDSEQMSFASGAFDCVTCRIAAHHFPSIERFIGECARVLAAGGILALADNVVSGEARIAKHVNAFEKLRDPSHHWAYSLDDWQATVQSAGFTVLHAETFEKDIDFADWAGRMGVTGDDLVRLKAMLVRAPADSAGWLRSSEVSGRLVFTLTEMVLIGRKAE